MRKALNVLGALFVVMVAAVVAAVVVLSSADYNQFKPDLEKLVKDATGRDLVVQGDLELTISLNPALSVSGVTLSNADWGRDQPMIKLERLDARVAVLPLFSGKLDVEYILIDGLDLLLETDGKGLANWEFETGGSSGSHTLERDGMALNPQIEDVRLENVRVTYIDGATQSEVAGAIDLADFSAADKDSPLKGHLEAKLNGVPLDIDVVLGSLAQLVGSEGDPFPVSMKMTGPGLSAEVTGSVEQPRQGMVVDARVHATAKDTGIVGRLVGVEFPTLNGIEVRANVTGGGTAYVLKGLDVQAGNSDFSGSADLDLSGKVPDLNAKLSSNVLYLKELAGLQGAKDEGVEDKDKTPAAKIFTSDPLPLGTLKTLNADVRYTAKRITAEPLRMTNVHANMTLKDGKLTFTPLSATLDSGRISARGVVDASKKTPQVDAHVSFRDVEAGALAALAGQGRIVSLKLDGEMDMKASGLSTQEIAASLNGYSNVIGRNGEIHDKVFTELTEGIGSIFPWAKNQDAGKITCMVAKLPFKNGVGTAETVMLDTTGVLVRITGDVDMAKETLNMTVHTHAKQASLASFAVPIHIKGTFVKPDIKVNPGEAVVGTVENIVKAPAELIGDLLKGTVSLLETDKEKKAAAAKDDPCIQALSGGKTTATPEPTAQPENEPAAKPDDIPSTSTGDVKQDLENFGKGLEKLF